MHNFLYPFFTPRAIAMRLKSLPPLKSSIVDLLFTNRVNHPMATVGKEEMAFTGNPAPLIMRGAPSLPVGGELVSMAEYEPFEFSNHRFWGAADLNNLKNMSSDNINLRIQRIDDHLRRIVRAGTEVLCTMALTGTISYPIKLEGGGFDIYTVNLGTPQSFTPDVDWDDESCTIKMVFEDLQAIAALIENTGYGTDVEFLVGKSVFSTLMGMVDLYSQQASQKIKTSVEKNSVNIGGYILRRNSETYRHPETGVATQKVPVKSLMAYATESPHSLFYCAIDDLDGNLQAMPYFSKPIPLADPSGVRILGRSKPFPIPVVKALVWSEVLA